MVAARYVEAGDDKYIETVMEIDAARFPKLAKEIKDGGLDSVSMGVEAGFTICSYCGNRAVDVPDFCEHVKYHKGQRLGRINERTGAVEPVMVYEKCYKLGFFELSYVFDPADETSVVSRVIAANHRYAQAPVQPAPGTMPTPVMPTNEMPTELPPTELPPSGIMPTAALEDRITRLAYGEIEAPAQVDTLRDENEGEAYDGKRWVEDPNRQFQNLIPSPPELQGPDLDQAKRLDRDQEQEGLDTTRRVEDVENISGSPTPQQGVPMPTRNARRRGRRYAADEDDIAAMQGNGGPPPDDGGDAGGPPPDEGDGGGGQSDEELIQEGRGRPAAGRGRRGWRR